jgi:beta-mannosidase
MYPHRIRLHGPWEFEPIARSVIHADGRIEECAGDLPTAGRLKIPATYRGTTLDGFRGRVRWRRRFHAPRTLDAHERLWIRFHGIDYLADVRLNDTPLGCHEGYFDPFSFDITQHVRPNNELVVDVSCPATKAAGNPWLCRGSLDSRVPDFVGGIWRDVALEVRSIAWLESVVVRSRLHEGRGYVAFDGTVQAADEASVELDLSVGGAWVAKQRVAATRQGTRFTIEAALDRVSLWWPAGFGEAALHPVRLEVHAAATTLDAVEARVGFREFVPDPIAHTAWVNDREVALHILEIESNADPLFADARSLAAHISASRSTDSLSAIRIPHRVLAPVAYDWADANGVVLIQEFPWEGAAGGDDAGDSGRTKPRRTEAMRQAKEMVRLLSHHPSVVANVGCKPHGQAPEARQ